MKKKILFVNESLALAGGEKSLIALLSKIDSDKYGVDLQLFRYGGALDALIPGYVNVLPPLAYSEYVAKGWKQNILEFFTFKNWSLFKAKLTYSLLLKFKRYNNPEKAQLYWESVGRVIENNDTQYDVAIAYAQGVPTFYVVDKIQSKKKIAWVNAKLNFSEGNKAFQYKFYKRFDSIVPVSEITYQQIKNIFPDLMQKFYTISDLIDYMSIVEMANFQCISFKKNTFNILTVARLNKYSKRYDITLEACKILRDRGVDFHWYALGEGPYRTEMEKYIKENNLVSNFTLLGTTLNPYPYFKAANLYVQTSQYESFGISIAEARLLNIPVVTTKFDTVFMQMKDGKNGLVVDLNASAVADGIQQMMEDKELYSHIVSYLKQEQKENFEPLERFYKLIDG